MWINEAQGGTVQSESDGHSTFVALWKIGHNIRNSTGTNYLRFVAIWKKKKKRHNISNGKQEVAVLKDIETTESFWWMSVSYKAVVI